MQDYSEFFNFLEKFWNFYLELEDEFLEIEKVIPVKTINFNTFSYSYLRLLGLICSEIDIVFKKLIEFKKFPMEHKNMGFYRNFIEETYDIFIENEVYCHNLKFNSLKLNPFIDWSLDKHLEWWDVNSAIKHNRNEKMDGVNAYKLANQKNVLDALSALFQLNMYYYHELAEEYDLRDMPLPKSNIFKLSHWG